MNLLETKQAIESALGDLANKPLADAAIALWDVLGYNSQKRLTLQPNTAENFVKSFVGKRAFNVEQAQHWNSRGHFFAAAAEAMRRILVEQARHKKSAKGGGQVQRVDLHDEQLAAPSRNVDLIALDEALDKLANQDSRKAELVKLRFFAGLTIRQAADALGIAESTADADWAYAKSWLRLELADASANLL